MAEKKTNPVAIVILLLIIVVACVLVIRTATRGRALEEPAVMSQEETAYQTKKSYLFDNWNQISEEERTALTEELKQLGTEFDHTHLMEELKTLTGE